MNDLTLSIFKNITLSEIISELRLFAKYKIRFYEDLNLCIKDILAKKQILIIFKTEISKIDYEKVIKNKFPIIVINKFKDNKKKIKNEFIEHLNYPFKIIDFEKKVISLFAKYEFNISSFINLKDYVIDKNERKIKKNNLELQLTEKEIDFLILFSQSKEPLTRNFLLKSVWQYSSNSDTHTVETHIHRLRKKILEKFEDNNFIKNNNKGYYI